MLKATQLRPGMVIMHEGQLYTVHSVDHRTPGNKRGAMATKMRSLKSGSIIDYRFRAEDFVERAVLDEIEFQYMYNDAEGYHFMNTENFEQIRLGADVLGEAVSYLIPDMVLHLEFYEGKYQFTKVYVRPVIVVENAEVVAQTEKTIHDAHEKCLIANSIRSQVFVEPTIKVAGA